MRIPMRMSFCKESCLLRACSFTGNQLLIRCGYGRHYLDFSHLSCFLIISKFRHELVSDFNHLMNFQVSRKQFEIIDIMTMPEAVIWTPSAEYIFSRVTGIFEKLLEEVFVLNLGLKLIKHFRTISMSFITYWSVILLSETTLAGCFCKHLIEPRSSYFSGHCFNKFFNNLRFYSICSDIDHFQCP